MPRAARTHVFEVAQNRLTGLTDERVFLRSPLFGTRDGNHFTFPVHIFQARAKPWLARWFRNRSRASANGPLRCRATIAE
jgi:hypothetical protein